MTQPATGGQDHGHLLPEEQWRAVVLGAQQRRAQLAVPPDPSRRGLVDRTITARSHGGTMTPRLGVIHSAETPLQAGYAYSIAANWFATKATTSATVMIDPAETIRLLPDTIVSYAVGPNANGFTVNVEQAGYASFGRAIWLSLDGRAQLGRVADYMRDCRTNLGIPLRWATDTQIHAAATGGAPQGWCTHDDVRRVLGGTVHTDPGAGYPRDELMAAAAGGQPPTQEDDMAQFQTYRNNDNGEVAIAAPGGIWYHVPSPAYLTLLVARGVATPGVIAVAGNEYAYFRDFVFSVGAPPRPAAGGRVTTAELPLTEEDVLAQLEELGVPVLTMAELTGYPDA